MNPTSSWARLTDVPLWNGSSDTSVWTAWIDNAGTQYVDVRTSTEAQFAVGSRITVVASKKESSEWDE